MTSPQNESKGPAYNTNAFDAISISRPSEGLRRVADLFDAVQREGLSDGLIVQRVVGDVSGFGKRIAAVTNAESILKDIRTGVNKVLRTLDASLVPMQYTLEVTERPLSRSRHICHDIICSWSTCFFMLLAHILCPYHHHHNTSSEGPLL
jgi:hypothetical protein